MKHKKLTYGVPLTELEEMKFSKHLQNNLKLPSPNTITRDERKQLVLDWLALNVADGQE